jgi:hypothetical protein
LSAASATAHMPNTRVRLITIELGMSLLMIF